jgi:hypothetical protein
VIALGANAVLALMAIQALFVFTHAVWLAATGRVLEGAEPGRIAGQIASLRLIQGILWVVTAGLFLAWIHRTHRVLDTLGAPGARSARDGLRDCLIPGSNLARIPRVVMSLWRVSAEDRTLPAVRSWVGWWWGLCLASLALDLCAVPPGRWLLAGLGIGGGLPLLVFGECVRTTASVLTIVIVTRIERPLRDRHAAMVAARGTAGA